MKYDKEQTTKFIEDGVGNFFRGIFRLTEDGLHQEAYDSLGTLLTMIQEERQHLRRTQNIEF